MEVENIPSSMHQTGLRIPPRRHRHRLLLLPRRRRLALVPFQQLR